MYRAHTQSVGEFCGFSGFLVQRREPHHDTGKPTQEATLGETTGQKLSVGIVCLQACPSGLQARLSAVLGLLHT